MVALESARRATFAAHAARGAAYLKGREEEKARRQRESLRRVAPGFEPSAGGLVPTRAAAASDEDGLLSIYEKLEQL